MATVPGIDVSYWDSGIDWPKVRATGQRYVFIKASEGDSYADPTFDDNWRGEKSAGLLRGAYHFVRSNVDPKKQATKFIDYVKSMNDDGELPPVLDLETPDGVVRLIDFMTPRRDEPDLVRIVQGVRGRVERTVPSVRRASGSV